MKNAVVVVVSHDTCEGYCLLYCIVSYHGRGIPCGAIRIGMDEDFVVVTLVVRGGEDKEDLFRKKCNYM